LLPIPIAVARRISTWPFAITGRVTAWPIAFAWPVPFPRRIAADGRIAVARPIAAFTSALSRGKKLLDGPRAVPVAVALDEQPFPAGTDFGIVRPLTHGQELVERDCLVAVPVVAFEDLQVLRTLPVHVAAGGTGVSRARFASHPVGIRSMRPVAQRATFTHLVHLATQFHHLALQLENHAVQRRFALGLRTERSLSFARWARRSVPVARRPLARTIALARPIALAGGACLRGRFRRAVALAAVARFG
jgi:hypothetical protein